MPTSCEIVRLIQSLSEDQDCAGRDTGKARGGAIARWPYSMDGERLQSCAR